MKRFAFLTAIGLIGIVWAGAAGAHATLEQGEAHAGSFYKAVVRVPHGCDGEATLKVRVRIPEGYISVKPQPKAGWTLEIVRGPYEQSYDYFGTTLTEGVREVIWTGELSDDHYDEFVVRGKLDESLPADTMLYVPVVQECATKVERWIEIPADGQDADDLEYPAPGVLILPATEDDH